VLEVLYQDFGCPANLGPARTGMDDGGETGK
jgi:hypothetical protein